jgi:hypothetical protein
MIWSTTVQPAYVRVTVHDLENPLLAEGCIGVQDGENIHQTEMTVESGGSQLGGFVSRSSGYFRQTANEEQFMGLSFSAKPPNNVHLNSL